MRDGTEISSSVATPRIGVRGADAVEDSVIEFRARSPASSEID